MAPQPAHSGADPPAATPRLARLLQDVNQTGGRRDRTRHLARLIERAGSVEERAPSTADTLPVVPELAPLLPTGGLRRGGVYQVTGSGALLWTLIGGAMAAGAWCAVIGMPGIAHASAAAPEYAVDLTRLAFVNAPGPEWPAVVAALLDGIDLVVVAPPPQVGAAMARQLRAKARTHRSVLVLASQWPHAPVAWPDTDLSMTVTDQHTSGLGDGRGRIRHRAVTVRAVGRGAATRARELTLRVPPPSLWPDAAPSDDLAAAPHQVAPRRSQDDPLASADPGRLAG